MTTHPERWVQLGSEELTAAIDPMGAQLSLLRDAQGRDLLWSGDAAVWAGRAPILFPVVGALAGGRYRLGSTFYVLSRHGFARGSLFTTVHASRSSAVFKLAANDTTRAVYPFDFQLDLRFAIEGSSLAVTTLIKNLGIAPMPASQGYHPAFRWPLPFGQPRASHFVEFAHDESSHLRRLDAQGLLTSTVYPTLLTGRRLALADSLFEADALIFEGPASRSVSYGAEFGPRIEVSFPEAPFLGIWTKPGAQFLCLEPWHGVADPVGYAGDFRDKPGIFTIAPGSHREFSMTISLRNTG